MKGLGIRVQGLRVRALGLLAVQGLWVLKTWGFQRPNFGLEFEV